MDDDQSKLNLLLARLEMLIAKQERFSQEINELRSEINHFRIGEVEDEKELISGEKPVIEQADVKKAGLSASYQNTIQRKKETEVQSQQNLQDKKPSRIKADLEKFIGENLINKIGIAITIIGVGIGVKYSIDHDLVTPLMRVITGYVTGIVLLVVGARLKTNYESYSAVLVSGAMAIMYFITFSAYSFYELMPLTLAFGVMVVFTVFTVLASISYNQQVISLIGLVGAYAVPFLLSDDSGNVKILLSYISIINIGILVVAVLRYWKLLYYSSFILSWLIFGSWFVNDFSVEDYFALKLIFSSIFFLTFYATFLVNKLIRKEKFSMADIAFLVMNSFIFYGFGYITLDQHEIGKELLGLYTVGNAVVHFIVSVVVFRQRMSDRNLFFLIVGMVLVFITIAIPVQLDGRWVTLLWIGEAALLFWIGRTKEVPVYEKLSYPLMLLAFFSLLHDWNEVYDQYIPDNPEEMMMPVFNIQFLSSIIFIACLGFILFLNRQKNHPIPKMWKLIRDIVQFSIPAMFLFIIFFAIQSEIGYFWDKALASSAIEINNDSEYSNSIRNFGLRDFKTIWIVNYSLLFFTILSIANMRIIRNAQLAKINMVLNGVAMLVFLTMGLYVLSDLRESYLSQYQSEYYSIGKYNLVIRYISYVFVIGLIVATYFYSKEKFFKKKLQLLFSIFMHISILWILSSELIHWLDIAGSSEAYKLGLSILWGSYSLLMIVLGIWLHKKYLRIMAIIIFGVTLVKLFLYDVSHLDTIPKTILFVSLGILLLIISFLYNKYKHIIADEE